MAKSATTITQNNSIVDLQEARFIGSGND